MWWVGVLILLVYEVHGHASPVSFLLDPRTKANGRFYTGWKQRMSTLPILVNDSSVSNTTLPLYLKARGRHFLWPTGQGLDVRLSSNNSVWARWRYAHWSNLSLTYSNTALLSSSSVNTVTFKCTPDTRHAWCHAGTYSVSSRKRAILGNPVVLRIRLDKVQGTMPAPLYFALTGDAQETRPHLAHPVVSLNPGKADVSCVDLTPTASPASPLHLCTNDMVYFDMGGDDESDLVLGSSYWHQAYSLVQVDGAQALVTAQVAAFDPSFLGWWWVGGSLSMATQLLYIIFILGRRRLTVRAFLVHQAKHAGRLAESWPVPWQATTIALGIVPLAIGAMVVAWLGGQYLQQNVDVPVLNELDFDTFTAIMTAYVGIQALLALIIWVVYDARNMPCSPKGACLHWTKEHHGNIRIAWLLHLCQSTALLGCWILFQLPLAVTGGTTGESLLVIFLTLPALILLHDHTYYVVPLVGFGIASRHANGWTVMVGIFELVMLGLVSTGIGYILIHPVVIMGSVVFGTASTPLAAVLLCATAMVLATVSGQWQARQALTSVIHEDKTKKTT